MKKMQISMELWNFWRESNDRFLREKELLPRMKQPQENPSLSAKLILSL